MATYLFSTAFRVGESRDIQQAIDAPTTAAGNLHGFVLQLLDWGQAKLGAIR